MKRVVMLESLRFQWVEQQKLLYLMTTLDWRRCPEMVVRNWMYFGATSASAFDEHWLNACLPSRICGFQDNLVLVIVIVIVILMYGFGNIDIFNWRLTSDYVLVERVDDEKEKLHTHNTCCVSMVKPRGASSREGQPSVAGMAGRATHPLGRASRLYM